MVVSGRGMVVSGRGMVHELSIRCTSQSVSIADQRTSQSALPLKLTPPLLSLLLPLPLSSPSSPPSRRFTKRIYIPLPSLEVSAVSSQCIFTFLLPMPEIEVTSL